MRKVHLLGLISALLCSCDPYYELVFENNSNHSVLVYWASGYECTGHPSAYPDTLLPEIYQHKYDVDNIEPHIIQPKKRQSFDIIMECSSLFSLLPKDTLSVFVIHGDTALARPWKDIKEKNNYIVRYDLSYSDYVSLKECIPFPPTEAMRDMKMWPPYEEIKKKYE